MSLDLRDRIRDVPDFPTKGVIFKDLMPLIADPTYFAESIRQLADWARPREPALVFGAEARGFIFGSALAYELGAGFIAARKPGKLPRETVEATLREVVRCTREGIRINTFMLDATSSLKSFIEQLTEINRGRAFFTTPETLGDYVLVDFIEHKRQLARGRRAG